MKEVIRLCPQVKYTGGDIVNELVANNNAKYASPSIRFIVLDLTSDRFPSCDLMFVRDCLFHLSYADIFSFFRTLIKSDIDYILTTNHVVENDFKNSDIVTGDFRIIDLLSDPFFLPPNPLEKIVDYVPPEPAREMLLFKVSDIRNHLEQRTAGQL